MKPVSLALAIAGTALVHTAPAHAQVLDRFSLHLEGGADTMLGGAPAQRFDTGGHGILRLGARIAGPLSFQVSGGSWWFPAHDGPVGRLTSVEGGLRAWFRLSDGVLGGPVIDANAGLGITGDLSRFMFDVGVGWDFLPTPAIAIGPMVRYGHIVQPDDAPQGPDDAQFLMFSLAITLRIPHGDEATRATPPPPADNDRDGVPDDADRCPNEPEDRDGFRDDDGCADPDNDGDGIPDAQDRCPDRAEVRNGFEDDDGCPDEVPAPAAPDTSASNATTSAPAAEPRHIGSAVLFPDGSSHIRSEVRPVIQAACEELRAHPEWRRIRVSGHADENGTADLNFALSAERAANVVGALIHCGVAPARIESAAMGSERPICTEHTPECHRQNRRVEFFLLEP